MIRYQIFLLFFLCPFFLFPQQKKELSELKKRIQSKSNSYTTNLNFKAAHSFFFKEEWDSTLVYTAKQLIEPNLELELLDYCYIFRGHSFRKKKLYKESQREFLKVSKGFYFYPAVQMFLGDMFLEQRKFDEAISYYKQLDSIDVETIYGIKKSALDHNVGISYLHKKDYVQAEKYLIRSVKAQERVNDTIELIGAYGDIANLYYEQYKDDQAIPYFLKAYTLAQKVKDFDFKRRTAKNMAVVEENRKDYIKALKYRKEYEQWKDSLNNQNRIYETAQLEKKIAVEQKQGEVNLLQAENKAKEAQKRVFLYSGILLLILLVILFYSYRGKVKRNKIITAQKEDLDVLNATKDKLFSIVSHDLRSSVNAIKTSNKNLLNNLESDSATNLKNTLQQNSSIVNGAYGLLDNLLNWALLQTQQSYFEIASLQLHTIVEHVAYNYKPLMQEKNIDFENTSNKKHTVKADQESLKIILRNLLDNAIKFSKTEGSIKVYSCEQDDYYDLIVEDSGIGMDESTIQELLKDTQLLSKKKNEEILGTGLGLYLVKSMIEKNHGRFAIESELENGTKMIVSLPKK